MGLPLVYGIRPVWLWDSMGGISGGAIRANLRYRKGVKMRMMGGYVCTWEWGWEMGDRVVFTHSSSTVEDIKDARDYLSGYWAFKPELDQRTWWYLESIMYGICSVIINDECVWNGK